VVEKEARQATIACIAPVILKNQTGDTLPSRKIMVEEFLVHLTE
jgi:predicted RNase H-like nuclease